MTKRTVLALMMVLMTPSFVFSQTDETTLYDSKGKAAAYIADDMTIYLWSGKPVAYLSSGGGGTSVYGFNGKHLGWFEKGYIRDHDGDAACGVKGVIRSPQLEALKSLKELKPLKSLKELAPLKPLISMSCLMYPAVSFWGSVPKTNKDWVSQRIYYRSHPRHSSKGPCG